MKGQYSRPAYRALEWSLQHFIFSASLVPELQITTCRQQECTPGRGRDYSYKHCFGIHSRQGKNYSCMQCFCIHSRLRLWHAFSSEHSLTLQGLCCGHRQPPGTRASRTCVKLLIGITRLTAERSWPMNFRKSTKAHLNFPRLCGNWLHILCQRVAGTRLCKGMQQRWDKS